MITVTVKNVKSKKTVLFFQADMTLTLELMCAGQLGAVSTLDMAILYHGQGDTYEYVGIR